MLPIPYHPSQDILDSTKVQCYQDCPRKFFYEYLLGWRPSMPSNHLHFGKCAHLALEHIHLNGCTVQSVIDALEIFNTEYRMIFPESTDEIFHPKTPARFFDALIEYVRTYRDDLTHYTLYKTEFGGTVSLGEDFTLAFKMDTILQDNYTGLYCSLEHKTAQGNYLSNHYSTQHEMGIQVGTYTHVLNCLFPPQEVSGVIINVICLKKVKKSETILARYPINLSNEQMYGWLENTTAWMKSIKADRYALMQESPSDDVMRSFPKNGRSCTNYNKACPYLGLCQGWINPLRHIDRMPSEMTVEFWNPLEENLREVLTL